MSLIPGEKACDQVYSLLEEALKDNRTLFEIVKNEHR